MSKFQDSVAGRLLRRVHWLEDGILAAMLLAMILLAVAQILLRNFFDTGIIWGDSLLRIMVIWVALAGAMVAGRSNAHIAIDILSPWVSFRALRIFRSLSSLFTTVVCGIMVYYSVGFILLELEDGGIAFANIPTWVFELIIPVAFIVLTLRFATCFFVIVFSPAAHPDLSKD